MRFWAMSHTRVGRVEEIYNILCIVYTHKRISKFRVLLAKDLCVCVDMHIYNYTHIYAYTYTSIYLCIYVNTNVHTYLHIDICAYAYIHMCMHIYICTYLYVYMNTRAHMHVQILLSTHTHAHKSSLHTNTNACAELLYRFTCSTGRKDTCAPCCHQRSHRGSHFIDWGRRGRECGWQGINIQSYAYW